MMGIVEWQGYLILTHAVTHVEDDPFTHHHILISRIVVKAVVGLSSILQLREKLWLAHFLHRRTPSLQISRLGID